VFFAVALIIYVFSQIGQEEMEISITSFSAKQDIPNFEHKLLKQALVN
jgi:hypothetical protein